MRRLFLWDAPLDVQVVDPDLLDPKTAAHEPPADRADHGGTIVQRYAELVHRDRVKEKRPPLFRARLYVIFHGGE